MGMKIKQWLQSLSFRTGVIVLVCCIPFINGFGINSESNNYFMPNHAAPLPYCREPSDCH